MNWNKILTFKRLKDLGPYQDKLPGDLRNDFDSDQGRIIFSPAIRRMHDKTQVFPLSTDDNVHTRLTHSLEVAYLARSMGIQISNKKTFLNRINFTKEKALVTIPTILSTISLCHDIGNPPFGHYGERVISMYFKNLFVKPEYNLLAITNEEKKDFILYNGNAQGFRLLATSQVLQDKFGLNLTVAVLAAYLKYPNLSDEFDENIKDKTYRDKLGVFQSEKEKLDKIRRLTGLNRVRHPLTFLMEAADNICYRVMDIEDAFNKKIYSVDEIIEYIKKNGNNSTKLLMREFTTKVLDRVDKNKSNYETTKMVQLRIFLIKHLVDGIIRCFLKNIDNIEKGKYFKELVDDVDFNLEQVLNKFCTEKIFTLREIQSLEVAGESVLKGLLDEFVPVFLLHKRKKDEFSFRANRLYGLISNNIKHSIEFETNKKELYRLPDYYKLRLILDFISSMTDYYALRLYQKLKGINIA